MRQSMERPSGARTRPFRQLSQRGPELATLIALGTAHLAFMPIEVLAPEIFLHIHDEILSDGSKRGLLHNFPSQNRLAVAPLGFITAEAGRGRLFLSSFHTFPTENTVVKTQSLIEKRG